MYRTIESCIVLMVVVSYPGGGIAYSSRSITQQSMPAVLSSIDERLRNLDKLCTYRHANAIEQHVRRLEALEAKIERFESILTTQLDKIEGNMSMQYFKEDIAKDQMLRKIDTVYERVHHKMFHIEMKIDSGERRIMEKLETMVQKIDRLEDAVNRKTDLEEVAEVFDALDDMKVSVNAGVANVTKTLDEKFSSIVTKLLQSKVDEVLRAINDTNASIRRGIHASPKVSPPVGEHLQTSIKNLESILNVTRYEQQNAMRSLVVQVGRLEGKNNMPEGDCASGQAAAESQQLTNISRKIDNKFDKLMEQQAIFLDSCHRIQSDEPQLESKITEILEKIIDVFEKESTVEIKDIQNIEQLIKGHDTTVRRSLYTTSHNMAVLLQKTTEHKDDLAQQVTTAQNSVAEVAHKLNVHFLLPNERILEAIQVLKDDLNKFDSNGNQVQVQVLRDVIREFSENVTEQQRSIDTNNIKIISDELRNVSVKMEEFLASSYSTETLLRRIEQLLVNYANNKTRDKDVVVVDEAELDDAIWDVFGMAPNQNSPQDVQDNTKVATTAEDNIVFTEVNCTSGLLDVRLPIGGGCTNCEDVANLNCTEIVSASSNKTMGNCTSVVIGDGVDGANCDHASVPGETINEYDIDFRMEEDNQNVVVTEVINGNQTNTKSQSGGSVGEDFTGALPAHNDGNFTRSLHGRP